MDRFLIVSLSVLLLLLEVRSSPPTIRQTQNGPVEGIEQISSLGQKYYSFQGIPFAEPPITGRDPYTGEQVDRRFKAPEALKHHWTDALKVHNYGKKCKQSNVPEFPVDPETTSEDCLFVNIFVPAGGAKHKTVMVWIHGGGFAFGDATDDFYGPDFLLSQDNIVVTIQYRLAIFGFLNLDYGEYTGNMGLKDQQLALKWVYENIEQFSGKRDEILIFGESAGGASVHFQMLNKESRKYFKRAFADSSSALDAYAMRNGNHIQHVRQCSKINKMDKLIEYLKTESGDALANCYPFVFSSDLDPVWVPNIEKPNTKGAFLTKSLEEIYESNEAPIMDSMFGFMAQEARTLFGNLFETSKPLLDKNVMETIVRLPFDGFTKKAYPKEFKKAAEKLRQAYFADGTDVAGIKRRNVALYSDMHFNYGILKAAILQSNANNKAKKNTFLFRFNVTADLNLMAALSQTKFDEAVHADDLGYLFHCHKLDQAKFYNKHLETKDMNYDKIMQYVKIVTNFARTGNPTIEGDTPFESCQSSDKIFCQEISNEPETRVTNDIMDQLHYHVWHDIENIYKNLKDVSHKPEKVAPAKEEL